MKKLTEIFDSNLIVPTGWTLIHSIWQALAIALIISTFAYFFKSKSNLKYWLYLSGLGLQSFISVFTFGMIYQPKVEPTQTFYIDLSQMISTERNLTLIEQIKLFIASNLDLFVNLWMLGIIFLIVKFLVNYWYVNRLKVNGTRSVNQRIAMVFNELICKSKFLKKVQIFESTRVSIPMVIGHLKPIILLPIGLASGLTNQQLEAILAHELAHIRRFDFVINLIQSVFEILYFFNPSIWFISSQIRKERENCCDDFAIEMTGDKMLLAKALTQIENHRVEPSLAMAFGRKKYQLLERVKRILGVNATKNHSFESLIGSFLILIVIGFYFSYQKVNAQNNSELKTPQNLTKSDTTIVERKKTATYTIKRGINIQNGEVFVDRIKIKVTPEDSIKLIKLESEMDALQAQMQPIQDKMEQLGKQMQGYGEEIQRIHAPLTEKSHEMGELGNRLGKLSRQKVRLEFDLEDSEDDSQRKELRKKMGEVDKELAVIEDKMEDFNKLAQKIEEVNMSNYEVPMDSLNKLMELYERPIEELAQKMEKLGEQMELIIPENYRNYNLNINEEIEIPTKPKRIIEERRITPIKPIKPVKIEKNTKIVEKPIKPQTPVKTKN